MKIESTCFKNYKNGQKKKGSQRTYQPMTKRQKKRWEPFFKVMKAGKGKRSKKYKPEIYFLCFLKRKSPLRWSVGWGRSGSAMTAATAVATGDSSTNGGGNGPQQ